MKKKILVAVDGSIYSSNSLDYLIRLFRQDRHFSVDLLAAVSTCCGDQSWMSDFDIQKTESSAELMRKAKAERYLQDAKERLIRNGFPEENIATFVHGSNEGITNSIHHFARDKMYDALLVGRRGVGRVGEMLLGSVSADLVRDCHEVPLWIIDGNVTSTRFLLAVHTSTHSLMAADHLAFLLRDNPKVEFYIYHSLAAFGAIPPAEAEKFHSRWGAKWCEKNLDVDSCLYKAHSQILMESGIPEKQIVQLSPRRGIHPSHDLLRQARKHKCGTIVIGRRPRVDKGLLGGVSDRITKNAQNMAIWLVG